VRSRDLTLSFTRTTTMAAASRIPHEIQAQIFRELRMVGSATVFLPVLSICKSWAVSDRGR
jgi:hypothetical protein